jgi:hypothetical protein
MTEFEKLKFASEELMALYEKERKKKHFSQLYLGKLSSSINALRQTMYALNELAPKLELDLYEEDDIAYASIKVKGHIHEDTWSCLYDWKEGK